MARYIEFKVGMGLNGCEKSMHVKVPDDYSDAELDKDAETFMWAEVEYWWTEVGENDAPSYGNGPEWEDWGVDE